jgi:hypothetical protein
MTPFRQRVWLVVAGVFGATVFIGALGSAVGTVRSMQTVSTVDSLEQIQSSSTPLDIVVPRHTPTASPTASPTVSQASPATNPTTGPTQEFMWMLDSLATDDAPSSHVGYNRDLFKAWIDADSDGCDTRAEVLILESLIPAITRNTCTVSTGQWYSPYDGVTYTDASKLDIDHFVPLSEAWQSGAFSWSSERRIRYGNDLGYSASLIAVSASTNRAKSDSDPAKWMPTNRSYFCDYVATWVAVKWRWNLSVDTLERKAVNSVLSGCNSVNIPLPQRAG